LTSSRQKAESEFTDFFEEVEPKLRHALVAAFGVEVGREAAADALEYGWSNWARVGSMQHPVGYLYKVGRSRARRYLRRPGIPAPDAPAGMPWVEPGLEGALSGLSERQRTAVVLMHSFNWTHREIANFMGVAIPTVQKHVERALGRLRRVLEV
jgi:DNA-directed RNA polymerase specialized sigma24 family protein